MKKRSIFVLMGIVAVLAVAGCGMSEEKKEEVTKAPVSDVTEAPGEDITPADAVVTEPAQEEVTSPYELSVTFREETEEAKEDGVVYFRSNIYVPVFAGTYGENMNRFVTSLVEEFRETLPDAEENAKFDYEESKLYEYGVPMFPEAEELTVSCVWSEERVTVLKAEYYSNTGGAHPNMVYKTYVVDVTDGYKETFESMIEPYGLTTEEVVDFAVDGFRAEHGEELFETDDTDALKNRVDMFTRTNQWYFNENGLVLFANPYDIAAYAYGVLECEISYEELEQGLKK